MKVKCIDDRGISGGYIDINFGQVYEAERSAQYFIINGHTLSQERFEAVSETIGSLNIEVKNLAPDDNSIVIKVYEKQRDENVSLQVVVYRNPDGSVGVHVISFGGHTQKMVLGVPGSNGR